ncbi:MAG: C-terminal binding protein [Spirochaetales bacterium]|nr:C-terminal binding protein [Spirochaetales bacterium]
MREKKIVTAGDRVYLKFFDLDFFHEKAKEANARLVPFKDFDEGKFKQEISDADAIVVIDRPLQKDHLQAMTCCKIILALEVGYDFIDVAAATEKGIVVSNVPTYGTEQVALHALSLILACQRELKTLMAETSAGGWNYNVCKPLWELKGKKLGIIGLGRIGRNLVKKVQGLEVEPIAYDPYLSDDIFQMLGVKRCYDLEDLLDAADIISLHVPLTPETHHMIGERELARMKNRAILVNTCRGKVIDGPALFKALNDGQIAGAGLDVLEKEPPDPEEPLLNCKNLIVTPHAAWYSEESLDRLKNFGMDEVVRVLNGKRPRFVVNPEVFFQR